MNGAICGGGRTEEIPIDFVWATIGYSKFRHRVVRFRVLIADWYDPVFTMTAACGQEGRRWRSCTERRRMCPRCITAEEHTRV